MKRFIGICFLLTAILCGVISFSHDSVYAAEEEEWVEIGGSSKKAEEWKEFIKLMADSGEKKLRLVGDIDYAVPKSSKEDFINWRVMVKGNKSLDLNNHYIDFGWNPDTSYYYEGEGEDRERKLMYMITVAEGGDLTISDSTGTLDGKSGYIKFNGYIKACDEYYAEDDIRNIINVEKGGLFTLDSGKLLVGRQKDEYCARQYKTITKMVVGDAVTLSGGDFVMNGGRIEGRGYDLTYGFHSAICIRDKTSKSVINDGYLVGRACSVYQYSAYKTALSDNMDTHVEIMGNHTVKGGVFEVTNAEDVLITSCDHYYSPSIKLGEYQEAMPFTYTDENGNYAYDLPDYLCYKKNGKKITFYPDIQNDLEVSYSDEAVMNGMTYDGKSSLFVTINSHQYYDRFDKMIDIYEVKEAETGDVVWSYQRERASKADAATSIDLQTAKGIGGGKTLSQVLAADKEYILSCRTSEYWNSWNRNKEGFSTSEEPDGTRPLIIEHKGKELKFNTYTKAINRIDITGVKPPCDGEKADISGITVDVAPCSGVTSSGISMKWLNASDKNPVTTVEKDDKLILAVEITKKDDYSFNKNEAGSFIGSITLNGMKFNTTTSIINGGKTLRIYSEPFTVANPTAVMRVNIVGLKTPVIGEKPDYDASAVVLNEKSPGSIPCIDKVEIEWKVQTSADATPFTLSADNKYPPASSEEYAFKKGDMAWAEIKIYLKKGYIYKSSSGAYVGNIFGVEYDSATVEGDNSTENPLYLSVVTKMQTFTSTWIEGIVIEDLNVPYDGKTKDSVISPNSISGEGVDRYHYIVNWKLGNAFLTNSTPYAAGEYYTCNIILNATPGYQFGDGIGNYTGTITIPGYENARIKGSVTTSGNSIMISIEVAAENRKKLSEITLKDIEMPAAGEKPLGKVNVVTDFGVCTDEAALNWFHSDGKEIEEDELFESGKEYYYEALLTPSIDSVFQSDSEGKYRGSVDMPGDMKKAYVDSDGRLLLKSKTVEVHVHSLKKISGKEATCTDAGSKEYYVCACGKAYEDSELKKRIEKLDEWKVIPALGHDFGEEDKEEKCSRCDIVNPDYKAPETGAGATGNSGAQGTSGVTGNAGEQGETGGRMEYKDNKTAVESKEGYKVTTDSSGEAALVEMKKSGKKTITVPASVTVEGVTYKITTINAYAFKNCKSAKKVILPNTIKKINAYAFAKSNITSLKITVKKGAKLSVDKKAFKKSKLKKVEVIMSKKATKKEKAAVINAFKKAGIKKANIKVK